MERPEPVDIHVMPGRTPTTHASPVHCVEAPDTGTSGYQGTRTLHRQKRAESTEETVRFQGFVLIRL